MTARQQELLDAARTARARAYAPYSHFLVGAALRLSDGRIVAGVNVENCSYGLSICAERTALVTAAASGARPGDVREVAVVADAPGDVVSPCGACRQFLAEFAPLSAPVMLHNLRGNTTRTVTVGDLLPLAFTPASLE